MAHWSYYPNKKNFLAQCSGGGPFHFCWMKTTSLDMGTVHRKCTADEDQKGTLLGTRKHQGNLREEAYGGHWSNCLRTWANSQAVHAWILDREMNQGREHARGSDWPLGGVHIRLIPVALQRLWKQRTLKPQPTDAGQNLQPKTNWVDCLLKQKKSTFHRI